MLCYTNLYSTMKLLFQSFLCVNPEKCHRLHLNIKPHHHYSMYVCSVKMGHYTAFAHKCLYMYERKKATENGCTWSMSHWLKYSPHLMSMLRLCWIFFFIFFFIKWRIRIKCNQLKQICVEDIATNKKKSQEVVKKKRDSEQMDFFHKNC